jgi:hypothetical protein
MEIKKGKKDMKIVLKYNHTRNDLNFDRIDMDKCNAKVMLKNGRTIYSSEIKYITVNVKKEAGA